MRNLLLQALLTVLVVSNASCGGGGGSSRPVQPVPGNPPASPPQQPAPSLPIDSASTPLNINASKALDVSRLSLASPESLVQLAYAGINGVIRHVNGDAFSIAEDCRNSGRYESEVVDSDQNLELSPGDQILIRLIDECYLIELNDPATGELLVTLTAIGYEENGDLFVSGRITLPQPLLVPVARADSNIANSQDIDLRIRASFDFQLVSVPDQEFETLRVTAAGEDTLEVEVIASIDGTTLDRTSNLAVERYAQRDSTGEALYETTFSADYESGLAEGAFSCNSAKPLSGGRLNLPRVGEVVCDGANGGRVLLVSSGDPNSGAIEVSFASNSGDGLAPAGNLSEAGSSWFDVVEGALFSLYSDEIERSFEDDVAPLAFGTNAVAVVSSVAIDQISNVIYIANPTAIVAIDGQSLATINSVPISGQPGPIAVSDDGSALWLGYRDREQIQRLDTATFTLDAPVSLGTPPADVFRKSALPRSCVSRRVPAMSLWSVC